MQQFLDIFLHVDTHLDAFIVDHGAWVYALLFAIVFAETGLVVTPFLPGDSLLFAAGALAARGSMNVLALAGILIAASIAGDTTNYHVGRFVGARVFRHDAGERGRLPWIARVLNRRHLDRAHVFFERHGGKAVIMGKFVPVVRTFVPFVAGAGSMTYARFLMFNVLAALIWIGVCVGAGYQFGNLAWVREHFEFVVLGIIAVSLIPVVVEFAASRRKARLAAVRAQGAGAVRPQP